jgi:hypothetical protein
MSGAAVSRSSSWLDLCLEPFSEAIAGDEKMNAKAIHTGMAILNNVMCIVPPSDLNTLKYNTNYLLFSD